MRNKKEPKQYWFTPSLMKAVEQAHFSQDKERLFKMIGEKDWPGYKKQAMTYMLIEKTSEKEAQNKSIFRSWQRSKAYKTTVENLAKNARGQFTMSGLIIMISADLVFLFGNACLRSEYLINFSVDAIVGVIALILLVVNMANKYRLLSNWMPTKFFWELDTLSFLLCALLKLIIPTVFDVSLAVLFVTYILERTKFSRNLIEIQNDI